MQLLPDPPRTTESAPSVNHREGSPACGRTDSAGLGTTTHRHPEERRFADRWTWMRTREKQRGGMREEEKSLRERLLEKGTVWGAECLRELRQQCSAANVTSDIHCGSTPHQEQATHAEPALWQVNLSQAQPEGFLKPHHRSSAFLNKSSPDWQ